MRREGRVGVGSNRRYREEYTGMGKKSNDLDIEIVKVKRLDGKVGNRYDGQNSVKERKFNDKDNRDWDRDKFWDEETQMWRTPGETRRDRTYSSGSSVSSDTSFQRQLSKEVI